MTWADKKTDKRFAEELLNGVEFVERLNQLSMMQLFALQRLVGYAIEEKQRDREKMLNRL